jgi:cyclohexyl-isocyanide hydratase
MVISPNRPLVIGSLLYEGVDQIDLTGPFEVLSRLPGASLRIYGMEAGPVRDVNGLCLAPDALLEDAPQLDVLHVPGGCGQESLMENERVLNWLRKQAENATCVFSVCTGALLLGAAGLLRGRRATTYWAVHHLLPLYGAQAVDARVVEDGRFLFAAGVTAGIDGALLLAAKLRGVEAAQRIQLEIAYAPEPPFQSGHPDQAPSAVLEAAKAGMAQRTARRTAAAERFAAVQSPA